MLCCFVTIVTGGTMAPSTGHSLAMRLFISYKRGASPDEPLALQLYEQLCTRHTVFIDQAMTVGTPWAERIDQELRQADVLVLLLSAEAVGSTGSGAAAAARAKPGSALVMATDSPASSLRKRSRTGPKS